MAFINMAKEIQGIAGPTLPLALAKTYVQRALSKILDQNLWSFQLGESGWLSPSQIVAGTITATVGSQTITGNAVATTAWQAAGVTQLKQMQIRIPSFNLYNIVNYDGVSTLTIDRPWQETSSGVGLGYRMYQAYYPEPVSDFKRWMTRGVRDFTNGFWLWTNQNQSFLADQDPQRQVFGPPSGYVVPYRNSFTASPVLLFELWPHPISVLSWSLYFVRNGVTLVNDGDTLPYPLTEDLVILRAKKSAYKFRESQKSDSLVRGSGANWQFLVKDDDDEYQEKLRDVMNKDLDAVNNFLTKMRRDTSRGQGGFYNAVTQTLTVGR
jgi:hypothetical protein